MKSLPELERSIVEILVANGRSLEPFIKTFGYTGENVTKLGLGTLVGVFEIDEKSEDSAYIVNFLASVAKKEYFNNPRRGAVESFEAALHKINLALAELVKHGNVAWLGKFHGALGVFEKNNLHFSVTGDARILLLRNESLTDIASGLSSEESHIHPIKTFVEVSSGRLMPADKIILASPELLALFSLEDLRKNALRMDEERFRQFLRTALRNEVDMTGALVIDLRESVPKPAGKAEEKETETDAPSRTLKNVFSKAAFNLPKKGASETEVLPSQPETSAPLSGEYVDSKTGHIYIQGDTPGGSAAHPLLERAGLAFQGAGLSLQSFLASQGRWLRKMKKQGLIASGVFAEETAVAAKKTWRSLRRQLRKKLSAPAKESAAKQHLPPREEAFSEAAPQTAEGTPREMTAVPPKIITDIPLPKTMPPAAPEQQEYETPSAPAPTAPRANNMPPFLKEKLTAFYKKNAETEIASEKTNRTEAQFIKRAIIEKSLLVFGATKRIARRSVSKTVIMSLTGIQSVRFIAKNFHPLSVPLSIHRPAVKLPAFYTGLAPLRKKIFLGGSIGIFFVAGFAVLSFSGTAEPQEVPAVETPQAADIVSPLPIGEEKNAHLAATPAVLITKEDRLIASVLLDNETYLIASKSIWNVRENKSYPLPAGSGSAKYAAAMDDLRLVFVYTDQGEIFAWSPISRTFARNTLALPAGASVKDIGTYLTYLYVLDSATDQIYRFPRAESGFGQPSVWLKDAAAFEENTQMAVNETIFIAPDKTSVQAFFRGRLTKTLEAPNTPLSVTSLYTHPGLLNVYALDTENKRLLVWNQDGVLIAQYFSEQLAEVTTLSVNETTGEALVTTANSLLSFKLEK